MNAMKFIKWSLDIQNLRDQMDEQIEREKMTEKRKPHKHAEVLRAIADGYQIEGRPKYGAHAGTWEGIHPNSVKLYDDWEYRHKPEPKPDVVKEVRVSLRGGELSFEWNPGGGIPNANVVFTLDGETDKLIKAEVIG